MELLSIIAITLLALALIMFLIIVFLKSSVQKGGGYTVVSDGAHIVVDIRDAIIRYDISYFTEYYEKNSCDPNKKIDNKYPLHFVIEKYKTEIAKYLIDNGADINVKDEFGCTALSKAIGYCNDHLIDALIDKGADVNLANENKNLPLHDAIMYDLDFERVKEIFQKTNDKNAKGFDNGTPLHMAAAVGRQDIVNFLIEKEADKEAKDFFGRTPDQVSQFLGMQPCPSLKLCGAPQKISTRKYESMYGSKFEVLLP